jgi:uncharacterized membrane protein
MNLYLVVKTLHILSSVLLVGTGFGTAFYLIFTNRMPALAGATPAWRRKWSSAAL